MGKGTEGRKGIGFPGHLNAKIKYMNFKPVGRP